jgi:hypothetical protein
MTIINGQCDTDNTTIYVYWTEFILIKRDKQTTNTGHTTIGFN